MSGRPFLFLGSHHNLKTTPMENNKGGFKGFLITLAVILFSVVGFIVKILINSTPIEDFPSFTPIVIGTIFVASVGYLIYAMFFGKDSFYRKKRLEKKANHGKDQKGKTLREIYQDKKETVNRKITPIYLVIIAVIVLTVLGGLFYWFEYRPTEIKKNCSYTYFSIPEVKAVSREEAQSSKLANELCKEQIEISLPEYTQWKEGFDTRAVDQWVKESECNREYPIKEETEYQPQKDSRRDATKEEYEKCLRRSGILEE